MNLCKELETSINLTSCDTQTTKYYSGSTLTSFDSVSKEYVKKLVMASPRKSCESDPLPSWLLKKCLDQLLPTITKIVNILLSKGNFPSCYKNAIIMQPLLKKYNLNQDDLKNYRFVANLPFVSKIIEKAVCDKIDLHIGSNNLHEKFQSAYCVILQRLLLSGHRLILCQ